MTTMLLNNELKGIEIYFDNKPEKNILENLKGNGFRWHGIKHCWYAKQNEKTIAIAEQYTGAETETAPEQTVKAITAPETKAEKKTAKENIIKTLWELTRWNEETNNVNESLTIKEITALLRKQIKEQFPMCKFSINCKGYNSVNIDILSSPYEKDSEYLKAIQDYCTKLMLSYKYCTCYDPYGDYGSSYNFYGSNADIYYDYIQTEQTEEIKKDMIDFDSKKAEFEKAEEERKEAEFQQSLKKQEEEHKQYLIRQEEEKKEIELINDSVNIIEMEESKQYYVIGSQFANMNKNNTLDQYKEEIAKGEYSNEDVKITREIHFTNEKALEYFSNMLLVDFDFLAESGESYTDDVRIKSMTDYYQMTKEEQKTVQWITKGIAVYFNNTLQFIINTEGYNYSRYVGLVEGCKIQKHYNIVQFVNNEEIVEAKAKAESLIDYSADIITEFNVVKTWNNENWKEYKEALKATLKEKNIKLTKSIIQQLPEEQEVLKVAMYKLLIEVDGIQEQFKNADIQQGQKVTMFYITDFGGMATSRITFDKVEYTTYAQYNNAVKIIYTPERKRTQYYKYFHGDMLVYNGWLELPTEVLHEVEEKNGMTITSTKYGSCDKKQYDEIIEHFEQQGIKPIVNTYKPIF